MGNGAGPRYRAVGLLTGRLDVFFTLTPRSSIYTSFCGECQVLCGKIGEVLDFFELNGISKLVTEQVSPMADDKNVVFGIQLV